MTTTLRYMQVKEFIISGISSGKWPVGTQVPSENELVKFCNVSRMTARRALSELTQEGTLERVQGKGTFVADVKHKSSLIQIRNIATEIKDRGNTHQSDLILLEKTQADSHLSSIFQCELASELYHSILIHRENGIVIQLEDRYVSPSSAPDYIHQDFNQTTPNEYLSLIAPISEAEHIIEAMLLDEELKDLLEISPSESACLKLTRTTWSEGKVVSYAFLYHPGNRYQLGSRFTPKKL
ncbi:MAG: histidine utilization repressor [Pseudomonadota bacterium]